MTLFIFLQPHRLSDYQQNLGLGGSTFKGEKIKVKKLKGALSNPIPLVKRSSEQFLFLRLHVWKALPSIFSTSMGISMGKWPKSIKWPKSLFEVRFGFLRCLFGGFRFWHFGWNVSKRKGHRFQRGQLRLYFCKLLICKSLNSCRTYFRCQVGGVPKYS